MKKQQMGQKMIIGLSLGMVQKRRKRSSYRHSSSRNNRKRRTRRHILLWLTALLLLIVIGAGGTAYLLFSPAGHAQENTYVHIRPTTTLDDVERQLQQHTRLRYPSFFHHAARYYRLEEKLRPGRYSITPRMNIMQILGTLARGKQSAVRFHLRHVRTREDLVSRMTGRLMMKPEELSTLLADSSFCDSLGFSPSSVNSLFLPDAYEVNWDIPAKDLVLRLKKYYDRYWTADRRAQADSLGLTPIQVSIIASIVEEESSKADEYAEIAGLYIRRLREGMPLQADPTVKFAVGDFTIRRVLGVHLQTDSPYNTYRYKGLPPGPIRLPYPATMDSVLRANPRGYLYMCAREDFSGRHRFANTYAEHQRNAALYRKALDERGIK